MPNTAKKEAIRKAYGEYWEQVKDELHQGMYICLIDERSSTVFWNGIVMTIHDFDNHLYMPKSLQGIENNNGWIRIESEEDLPKETIDCFFFDKSENAVVCGKYNADFKKFNFSAFIIDWDEHITHYQPIIKPEKPIY